MIGVIAHYKFNENTSGDNAELVTNGDFSAWTGDDPDGWTVLNESASDPEISEVGTGEGHGGVGTGMCNLYSSAASYIQIYRNFATIVGRKYRVSIIVDTRITGSINVQETSGANEWGNRIFNSVGTYTWTYVATITAPQITVYSPSVAIDITIDDVSIKLCAVEDSSGNDHDGLAQQDTSAISVAGKINTAFDFNGSSDFIEIADHDDFTPAGTPFSISAWVYMHDALNFIIASKGIWGTDEEWQFYVAANRTLRLIYVDESSNGWIGRRKSVAITSYENQWIHLVATYDGSATHSGIKFYLNGIRVDDVNYSSGSFSAVENRNHAVWIGRYDTDYANGVIDNVTFFNRVLTADEVYKLYNQYQPDRGRSRDRPRGDGRFL